MHSRLVFAALSALLATTLASVRAEPSTASDAPALIKRHGGSNMYSCANPGHKLVFGSGNGCECKTECGSHQTECPGPIHPKTGDAVCTDKGCTIECHLNMELSNNKKDCVCKDGYEPSECGRYCVPKCKDGTELWGGQCVPKCEKYEVRDKDGKCVCKPSCHRNGENDNHCHPQCPDHSQWDEGKDKCVCKPGYFDWWGKCIPNCGNNMEWNGHECVCIPGCKKHPSGDHCTPTPSQAAHHHHHHGGHGNGNGHGSGDEGSHGGNQGHNGGHNGHHKKDAIPVWSSKLHTRSDDSLFCPDGLSACPISSTLGGFECVDVQMELEQCGGCIADGTGVDCTQLPGVSGVGCQNGQCVVFSCAPGYRLTSAGECSPALSSQRTRSKKRTVSSH